MPIIDAQRHKLGGNESNKWFMTCVTCNNTKYKFWIIYDDLKIGAGPIILKLLQAASVVFFE